MRRLFLCQRLAERLQYRRIEQFCDFHRDAQLLLNLTGYTKSGHGVAAEIEEVVAASNSFLGEFLLPDLRHRLFQFGLRCLVARFLQCGNRKCLSIYLSVGCQRESIQLHQEGRHHVFRHTLRNGVKQRFFGIGHAFLRHNIGSEKACTTFTSCDDCQRLFHCLGFQQSGLDFSQLNAEAVQLDLLVDSSAEDDISRLGKFPVVPGAVQPTELRMLEIVRLGFLGTGAVLLGNASSANANLSLHANRTNFSGCIQHIDSLVRQRIAIGNAVPCGLYLINGIIDRPDGCLRCTAQAANLCRRKTILNLPGQFQRNPVTAEQHIPQR